MFCFLASTVAICISALFSGPYNQFCGLWCRVVQNLGTLFVLLLSLSVSLLQPVIFAFANLFFLCFFVFSMNCLWITWTGDYISFHPLWPTFWYRPFCELQLLMPLAGKGSFSSTQGTSLSVKDSKKLGYYSFITLLSKQLLCYECRHA
jgi:hypothetical protein